MIKNEDGFTLVEILTSLYILGLLAFFTIPLFLELKEYEQQQASQLEATSWLQEKMERICASSCYSNSGKEERKSRLVGKQVYQLSWKCIAKSNNLYQIYVEIQWKKENRTSKLTLFTERFVRS